MAKKSKPKIVKCGGGEWRQSVHTQEEWVEMRRIVPLQEASRLLNLSVDTIRREFSDKIIKLSPRRYGMRLGDALLLSE